MQKVEVVGDEVVACFEMTGTGSASGVPLLVPVWHVLRFRGERVDRVRVFLARDQALAAHGRDVVRRGARHP